ncbi:hypothetical protein L6452_01067 [Arctium lappa]|uniref:Uncharacterized protein n=1 Tax=Arctium lappa TaxID=4217 RepID=A0ACB9FGI0_ARCLA|nr:hypothetical protein L6452_01067 [Arctium lappa]
MLAASTARELVDDPLKYVGCSKRWKIKSCYGDIGLKYRDDKTITYVSSRMSVVFSVCHRVLTEVKRRLPGFSLARVLDFGVGTGSAFWYSVEVDMFILLSKEGPCVKYDHTHWKELI